MYRQVHDGIIWFKLPEAFRFSYYWNCNFMPVSLPNLSYVEKWMGELDIIMQSANLQYKKVQNKHGKQLNFIYHFVLEHTRGLVRPASLSFARTRLNFWYQSKCRMTVTVWNWSVKTVLLRGLQMWLEPWVSKDTRWLSNPHQVALTFNFKSNKCQFHWTVFIKTQQSLI